MTLSISRNLILTSLSNDLFRGTSLMDELFDLPSNLERLRSGVVSSPSAVLSDYFSLTSSDYESLSDRCTLFFNLRSRGSPSR